MPNNLNPAPTGSSNEGLETDAQKKAERRARREAKFLEELRQFDSMPATGYVDVRVVSRVLDIAVGSVWRGVKNAEIPLPVYLGKRQTRWNVGELRAHIEAARSKPRVTWRCPPTKKGGA